VAISSAASAKKVVINEPTRSSAIESRTISVIVNVVNRQRRIDALHGAADIRHQPRGGQRQADHELHRICGRDRAREVDLGHRRIAQSVVPDVADHADHLEPRALDAIEPPESIDRVLVGPVA
jgi:hypothetical protein